MARAGAAFRVGGAVRDIPPTGLAASRLGSLPLERGGANRSCRTMFTDKRRLGVFVIGLAAFLQLWSIQALLPTLARYFAVTDSQVSLTVSATTLAVTVMAPFIGVVADVLGRRRIIVTGAVPAGGADCADRLRAVLDQIVVLRFVQGLLLPPVFAVAVAYIGDEFPRERIAAVTAIYTTGSVLGGFLSRFLAGWIGDLGGWRLAFFVLAAIGLGQRRRGSRDACRASSASSAPRACSIRCR